MRMVTVAVRKRKGNEPVFRDQATAHSKKRVRRVNVMAPNPFVSPERKRMEKDLLKAKIAKSRKDKYGLITPREYRRAVGKNSGPYA